MLRCTLKTSNNYDSPTSTTVEVHFCRGGAQIKINVNTIPQSAIHSRLQQTHHDLVFF